MEEFSRLYESRIGTDEVKELSETRDAIDQWIEGKSEPPVIEELLTGDSSGLDIARALCLLKFEIDRRVELGDIPTVQEYFKRFPNYGDNLIEFFVFYATTNWGAIGQKILQELTGNSFIFKEPIDSGGMAVVFAALPARSPQANNIVAIKIPRFANIPSGLRTIATSQEASIQSGLNHPNIVKIESVGLDQLEAGTLRCPYIVMEFVDGTNLATMIKNSQNGRLSNELTRSIAIGIASGMSYAHGQSVFHRDLKPRNILVNKTGKIKIADFGLGWVESHDPRLKAGGSIAYMSPEQIKGCDDESSASDVWSFGVVLYEMLTGRHPFIGTDKVLAHNKLEERIIACDIQRKPDSIDQDIAPDLNSLVLKCLHLEPHKRPTFSSILRELKRKSMVRATAKLFLFAVVFLCLTIGISISSWSPFSNHVEKGLSTREEEKIDKLIADVLTSGGTGNLLSKCQSIFGMEISDKSNDERQLTPNKICQELELAATHRPEKHDEYYLLIGRLHLESLNTASAIAAFGKVDRDSEYAEIANAWTAQAYGQRNEYKKALELLSPRDELISLREFNQKPLIGQLASIDSLNIYGRSNSRSKDYEKARENYEYCLQQLQTIKGRIDNIAWHRKRATYLMNLARVREMSSNNYDVSAIRELYRQAELDADLAAEAEGTDSVAILQLQINVHINRGYFELNSSSTPAEIEAGTALSEAQLQFDNAIDLIGDSVPHEFHEQYISAAIAKGKIDLIIAIKQSNDDGFDTGVKWLSKEVLEFVKSSQLNNKREAILDIYGKLVELCMEYGDLSRARHFRDLAMEVQCQNKSEKKIQDKIRSIEIK